MLGRAFFAHNTTTHTDFRVLCMTILEVKVSYMKPKFTYLYDTKGAKIMGCWIETDMLTNLPINYGERVAAVLIAQKQDPMRTSYPHQTWQPISPLIYGDYDDYGRIKDYDKNIERIVLDAFKDARKGGVQLVERDSDGAGVAFLKPDTTLGEIIAAAASNTLFLRTYKAERVALALLKPDYIERCRTFRSAADIHRMFTNIEAQHVKLHKNAENATNESDSTKALRLLTFSLADTFDLHNIMLDIFYAVGADVETVFCVNAALNTLRSVWRPTSNAGSQTGIECQEVVDWYQAVADDAKAMYCEYSQIEEAFNTED